MSILDKPGFCFFPNELETYRSIGESWQLEGECGRGSCFRLNEERLGVEKA